MDISKYIEIKNLSGQRTAFLLPEADKIKNCYLDKRLNGESTFEFEIPANSSKIDLLIPESTIWAGNRVFNLLRDQNIDFTRDEKNTLWAKFSASERWNELDYQYPEPYITNDPTTPTPADLAVIIVAGGSDLSGGRYTVGSAGHALYAVLNGSSWTVGTVDVTGTHDLEMEKVSRLKSIKEIQNIWGGYLVWDSVNKIVSLRSGSTWQNYTGFQIRYKKNLKNITRTQSNRIITKMYVFGHDDLDIASVNSGVKYLTNYSYTSREYVGVYKNQDVYNAQELKDMATAELALNCCPRYLYRVKMVDLRTLPEYSHEDFAVGDMADVIDPNIAPDSPRPRIIRHKYNLFKPWECEIELGDPEERLAENLKASFNTTGFVDSRFNGNGQSSGASIEDLTITNAKIINLEANKITTNEAKITTAQIESLIVGNNVTMGPDATISWDQVTDQPTIPELPSYIKSTYIDSTTVQSPIIIGGQIIGGSITSNSTISVSTSATIGDNLYLSPSTAGGKGIHMGASYLECQFNNSKYNLHMYSNGYLNLFAGGQIEINGGQGVYPTGYWDFSSASVAGLISSKSIGTVWILGSPPSSAEYGEIGICRVNPDPAIYWLCFYRNGHWYSFDGETTLA